MTKKPAPKQKASKPKTYQQEVAARRKKTVDPKRRKAALDKLMN